MTAMLLNCIVNSYDDINILFNDFLCTITY